MIRLKEFAKIDVGETTIEFDTSATSSILGRLVRLIVFPFVWVLTGKAKI